MTGGFSRAIDLIQSEYNWRDSEILEIPICRVRQMIEIIQQRKTEELRFNARIAEWQAKNIVVGLSALSEHKEQGKAFNSLLKKMRLPLADEEEPTIIDNRSVEEVIEQGAIVDMDKLPSAEQIFAAFGAPFEDE